MSEEPIHSRISQVMAARGVTQAELARLCGTKPSYINRVVHGSVSPSNQVLRVLMDQLDASPAWVLFGRPPMLLSDGGETAPGPPPTGASAPATPSVIDAILRLNEVAGLPKPAPVAPVPAPLAPIMAKLAIIGSGPGGSMRLARADGYLSSLLMDAQEEAQELVDTIEGQVAAEVTDLPTRARPPEAEDADVPGRRQTG
jgi:transcriptional regulator with XRE-family HTH domain